MKPYLPTHIDFHTLPRRLVLTNLCHCVLYFSTRISWMMGLNEIGGNEVCIGSVKFTFNIFHFLKFVHILNIYFILKLDFLDHPYNQCPKISYINKIIDRTTSFQKKTTVSLQGQLSKNNFPQNITK